MMQFLILRDGLVEVEDGVGHQRVGGQLGGGQAGVPQLLANGHEPLCCIWFFPEIFQVEGKIFH